MLNVVEEAMATLKLLSWMTQISMEKRAIQPKYYTYYMDDCILIHQRKKVFTMCCLKC